MVEVSSSPTLWPQAAALAGGGTAREEREGGRHKDSACGQQLYSAHLALVHVCTLAYLQERGGNDKETGRKAYNCVTITCTRGYN